jgi:hypothetical protein
VAQLGSALRSGRRGRGFKSRHPDSEMAGNSLVEHSDALDYEFHSAQVVSSNKPRKDDDPRQLAEDASKLREVYTLKPTVR